MSPHRIALALLLRPATSSGVAADDAALDLPDVSVDEVDSGSVVHT